MYPNGNSLPLSSIRVGAVVAAAVDQAIADLFYGFVVINHWGLLAYYMKITPWGAYPGNELHDIQSGIGFVNKVPKSLTTISIRDSLVLASWCSSALGLEFAFAFELGSA
jgi:hypothetical protein